MSILDQDVYVPCASLLKPLYAWVSPQADPGDVAVAITRSDNTATDRIVESGGGLPAVLAQIRRHTDVCFDLASTWGQVLVQAAQVEHAYDHLLAASTLGAPRARSIVTHMRDVVEEQRFGAPAGTPVKAGWDVELATGAVLVHVIVQDRQGRARVACTRNPIDPRALPVPFEGEHALQAARALRGDLAIQVLTHHQR